MAGGFVRTSYSVRSRVSEQHGLRNFDDRDNIGYKRSTLLRIIHIQVDTRRSSLPTQLNTQPNDVATLIKRLTRRKFSCMYNDLLGELVHL